MNLIGERRSYTAIKRVTFCWGYDDQELKLEIPNQQYAAKSTSRDYSKWGVYNVNMNGVCVFVVLICIVCRLNNSGNYILLGRQRGREGRGREVECSGSFKWWLWAE